LVGIVLRKEKGLNFSIQAFVGQTTNYTKLASSL